MLVFGIDLLLIGPGLVLASGVFLPLFGFPPTDEVRIRVVVVAFASAPPALLLFGAVDLAAALRTAFALRQEKPSAAVAAR